MSDASSWVSADSVGVTAVLMVGHRIKVTSIHAVNTVAAASYLQVYDAATVAAVTVGTTVPKFVLSSASSAAATQDFSSGIIFENGVVVAGTTTNLGNTGATQHVRLAVQ